jgi:hypothetical protein
MSLTKKIRKDISPEERQRLLSEAFMNIKVKDNEIWNPLTSFPKECADNPHLYILYLLTQPEYFAFAAKEILNIELLPFQCTILETMWNHRFPMMIATRGMGKTFIMAVYNLLQMFLNTNRQIVITGSAFRQSKLCFEAMEKIWNGAPLLRNIFKSESEGPAHSPDSWNFRMGDNITRAIPIGTGERIRGLRANIVEADEFKSVSREIFETVIAGFTSVSSNVINMVKSRAAEKLARELNIEFTIDEELLKNNQLIIAGTCDYSFNHFADYWKRWREFILSRGRKEELEKIFTDGIPEGFNYKDYCIIRVPYKLLPDGYMDAAQISRSKVSMLPETFAMEFEAVFVKDSSGFFKRSILESCTASGKNSIQINGKSIIFTPTLRGEKDKKYVYGIDPASEVDKFSIVIIELHEAHSRIVYCWTTDKKEYREKYQTGLIPETDFYAYCARKIRNLMKVFPCEKIAMDSQGGGYHVLECLHDKDKIQTGERPIWTIINPQKPSDTDGEFGEHIVELINFADAKWVENANHGLKKDFLDKICLFPHTDGIDYALASIDDENSNRLYDTLEDCIFDIEELKNELSNIVMTKTPSGRDRWDTPEIKLPGQKKGRLRKDRYSALLMANMVAREIQRTPEKQEHSCEVGWAAGEDIIKLDMNGPAFSGPAWASKILNSIYD